MTDQAETIGAASTRRVRMDWRTGQAMVQHPRRRDVIYDLGAATPDVAKLHPRDVSCDRKSSCKAGVCWIGHSQIRRRRRSERRRDGAREKIVGRANAAVASDLAVHHQPHR